MTEEVESSHIQFRDRIALGTVCFRWYCFPEMDSPGAPESRQVNS